MLNLTFNLFIDEVLDFIMIFLYGEYHDFLQDHDCGFSLLYDISVIWFKKAISTKVYSFLFPYSFKEQKYTLLLLFRKDVENKNLSGIGWTPALIL